MKQHLFNIYLHIKYRKQTCLFNSLFFCIVTFAQEIPVINSSTFFKEEAVLHISLISDFSHLQRYAEKETYQPAIIILQLADSSLIKEEISIKSRGNQRKNICAMPPLMLLFNSRQSTIFKNPGRLKLITGCANTSNYEQLIFKEFLTYKIYNLITEKSFRVRLVQIHFRDTHEKIKPYIQYGFFLEDVDEMAQRNNCRETGKKYQTEQTNRKQTTLLALFQYMIGNTDWEVSVNKNIKLIKEAGSAESAPYAVPFDFDYAGLVNAGYAVPHPFYEIESVTERVYKGFSRTSEELDEAIAILQHQKEAILNLIRNFKLLESYNRREMADYIETFYRMVQNKHFIKTKFINNARKQ